MGYSPWGHKELGTTEPPSTHNTLNKTHDYFSFYSLLWD